MHCHCGYLCIKKKTTLIAHLSFIFSTHSHNRTRKYLIKVLETFVKQLLPLASHLGILYRLYRDPLRRIA